MALRSAVKAADSPFEFLPDTTSGSLSLEAFGPLMTYLNWSDLALFIGDLGRSSETALLLENVVQKYRGRMVITRDSVHYFKNQPSLLTKRQGTIIVLSFADLQHMLMLSGLTIKFSSGLVPNLEKIAGYSVTQEACFVTRFEDYYLIAEKGRTAISKSKSPSVAWRANAASGVASCYLNNPIRLLNLPQQQFLSYNTFRI